MRAELCAEAIRLARVLVELLPREAEAQGLLALMLLQDSRRATRADAEGAPVLLAEQDRGAWDRAQIAEGLTLVEAALRAGPAGPYGIQAAIAALHARAERAEDTDWAQIVLLYDALLARTPSPVVALNRAVALAMSTGPARGLAALEALDAGGELGGYLYFHATRADLLRRLGRLEEARRTYERALGLADNAAERAFLARRLEELEPPRG